MPRKGWAGHDWRGCRQSAGAGKMRSVVDVGRSRDAAYKWAMEALGAAFVVKDFLKEVFVHAGPSLD
jgi:hypothetical protein